MIKTIENYIPKDDFEIADKKFMLKAYQIFGKQLFNRFSFFHFSSSAVVVNENFDKVLFIYHKIYRSWGWMGGHMDGSHNFFQVSKKEILEESGIKEVKPLSKEPISIEILPVWSHYKNGEALSSHQHLNVTYAFIANEEDELTVNKTETKGVKWILISELDQYVNEKVMLPVYQKIIRRILDEKANHL